MLTRLQWHAFLDELERLMEIEYDADGDFTWFCGSETDLLARSKRALSIMCARERIKMPLMQDMLDAHGNGREPTRPWHDCAVLFGLDDRPVERPWRRSTADAGDSGRLWFQP